MKQFVDTQKVDLKMFSLEIQKKLLHEIQKGSYTVPKFFLA